MTAWQASVRAAFAARTRGDKPGAILHEDKNFQAYALPGKVADLPPDDRPAPRGIRDRL